MLFLESVGKYLERLDNGAATKRIASLADQLGIHLPTREALVASFTSGYSLLDPTRPATGSTDSTYRLRVKRRAGHAGADGGLTESATSQSNATCCVTPPSIHIPLHKIRQ